MVQEIYREHPELYDEIHDAKDYEGEVEFLRSQFDGQIGNARVLDVGCGTAEHAKRLSRHGCKILGVDANESMLQIADRKCGDAVTFQKAQLPELSEVELDSREPFDLIIMLYDVINYLSYEELEPTLRTLANSLAEDGVLIFDNADLPADGWDPGIHSTHTDSGEYVRLRKLDRIGERSLLWEAAVFVQQEDDFDFFTDTVQYTRFENGEIVDILNNLEFDVEVYDGYGTSSETDDILTVFVATKIA